MAAPDNDMTNLIFFYPVTELKTRSIAKVLRNVLRWTDYLK
jgi:hypothetical protein